MDEVLPENWEKTLKDVAQIVGINSANVLPIATFTENRKRSFVTDKQSLIILEEVVVRSTDFLVKHYHQFFWKNYYHQFFRKKQIFSFLFLGVVSLGFVVLCLFIFCLEKKKETKEKRKKRKKKRKDRKKEKEKEQKKEERKEKEKKEKNEEKNEEKTNKEKKENCIGSK